MKENIKSSKFNINGDLLKNITQVNPLQDIVGHTQRQNEQLIRNIEATRSKLRTSPS